MFSLSWLHAPGLHLFLTKTALHITKPPYRSVCLCPCETSEKPANSPAPYGVFLFNHVSVRDNTLHRYSHCLLTRAEGSSFLFRSEHTFPMMIGGRKGLYLHLFSIFQFFTRTPARVPHLLLLSAFGISFGRAAGHSRCWKSYSHE